MDWKAQTVSCRYWGIEEHIRDYLQSAGYNIDVCL